MALGAGVRADASASSPRSRSPTPPRRSASRCCCPSGAHAPASITLALVAAAASTQPPAALVSRGADDRLLLAPARRLPHTRGHRAALAVLARAGSTSSSSTAPATGARPSSCSLTALRHRRDRVELGMTGAPAPRAFRPPRRRRPAWWGGPPATSTQQRPPGASDLVGRRAARAPRTCIATRRRVATSPTAARHPPGSPARQRSGVRRTRVGGDGPGDPARRADRTVSAQDRATRPGAARRPRRSSRRCGPQPALATCRACASHRVRGEDPEDVSRRRQPRMPGVFPRGLSSAFIREAPRQLCQPRPGP